MGSNYERTERGIRGLTQRDGHDVVGQAAAVESRVVNSGEQAWSADRVELFKAWMGNGYQR